MSTTSSNFQDELYSMRDKMNSLVDEIGRTQQYMERLVERSSQISTSHDEKIRTLEQEAEALRRENARLRKRPARPDSGNARELMNAVAAREAALKKLRLAYQVTRDVLKNLSQKLELEIENLPGPDEQLTPAEERAERRAMLVEMQMQHSSPSMTSSSESSTPRAGPSQRPIPKPNTLRPTRSEPGPSRPPRSSPELSRSSKSSTDVTSSPKVIIEDVEDTGNPYWINDNLPTASEVVTGPVDRDELQRVIQRYTNVERLDSLATAKIYPPVRLELIGEKLAFAYDPIIVEATLKRSYIVDWADEETAGRMVTERQALHTFLGRRGDSEDKWHYVGKLTWERRFEDDIWDLLTPEDRRKVTAKLAKRLPPYLTEQVIEGRILRKDLIPVVFEISSEGHTRSSAKLAVRMGFTNFKHLTENGTFE